MQVPEHIDGLLEVKCSFADTSSTEVSTLPLQEKVRPFLIICPQIACFTAISRDKWVPSTWERRLANHSHIEQDAHADGLPLSIVRALSIASWVC